MPAGIVAKLNQITIATSTVSISLGDFLRAAAVTMGPDQVEDTSMSDSTHTFTDGLQNHAIRATVKMGYGTGSPDDVLTPLILNGTEVAVYCKVNKDAAVSASNPSFAIGSVESPVVVGAKILGPGFAAMGGRVGELVESEIVVVPTSGNQLVRSTTV